MRLFDFANCSDRFECFDELLCHMEIMGVCTVEDKRLYSYRRDGRTGGMAAYLRLLASD